MHKKFLLLLLMVLIVSVGFLIYKWHTYAWLHNGNLEMYSLDVGQGDAMLMKSPQGKLALVDAGRGSAVLSELGKVLPFGVRDIDFAIFTHADADHVEGFISLMNRYEFDKIYWNEGSKQSTVAQELKRVIDQQEAERYQLKDANDFIWGCCVEFDIVWPRKGTNVKAIEDINNSSIAFLLEYNQFQLYAGGDLDKKTEVNSIRNKENTDVDILKVGHHGSKTSTSNALLQALKPEVSLISAGKNNDYGHPHTKVLRLLNNFGLEVLRTDLHGNTKIVVDQEKFIVFAEKAVEKKAYTL